MRQASCLAGPRTDDRPRALKVPSQLLRLAPEMALPLDHGGDQRVPLVFVPGRCCHAGRLWWRQPGPAKKCDFLPFLLNLSLRAGSFRNLKGRKFYGGRSASLAEPSASGTRSSGSSTFTAIAATSCAGAPRLLRLLSRSGSPKGLRGGLLRPWGALRPTRRAVPFLCPGRARLRTRSLACLRCLGLRRVC